MARDKSRSPVWIVRASSVQCGNSSNRAISTMPLCWQQLDLNRYSLDRNADLLRNWRPNVHALSISLDADH
jgi:hypothetical protein